MGNQTSRTIGGTAYTQSFDYDNRLLAVAGGSVSAAFLYDADGNRAKGTVASVTTVYIAGIYEWQNGATTKYYEGGAFRRVGYASNNGVFYALSDHLRSTSVLVNQNGTLNTNQYFYPYGGNRDGAFSSLTTKRFTGQYHEQSLPGGEGLAYYNARWYDAQVGVFVSADTLVPSPLAPQTLNRFAYAGGNPLRYTDPTGHVFIEGTGGGGGSGLWRLLAGTPTPPGAGMTPAPQPVPTAPSSPIGTPVPSSFTSAGVTGGGSSAGWSWDALLSPDTVTTIVVGAENLSDYGNGFVNAAEGYAIYKVLGNDGKFYWVAAGSVSALKRAGLNPGVANSATALRNIRAAGRGGDLAILFVGAILSVGPNLVGHAVHGDLGSPAMSADLSVDFGGWVASDVGAFGLGAVATGFTTNPVVGLIVEPVSSVGISLYWDNWIAPGLRVRAVDFFSR